MLLWWTDPYPSSVGQTDDNGVAHTAAALCIPHRHSPGSQPGAAGQLVGHTVSVRLSVCLPACPSACLLVHLPVYLLFASCTVTAPSPSLVQLDNCSVMLSVCPSVGLSVCSLHPAPSQHRVPTWCSWTTGQLCCLSICPSVRLSIYPSVCALHPALSQHMIPAWCSWTTGQSCCLSSRLANSLLVCLSFCLADCLSVCLSVSFPPG